jgi:tetratricopeptide (TPR) repeat protein
MAESRPAHAHFRFALLLAAAALAPLTGCHLFPTIFPDEAQQRATAAASLADEARAAQAAGDLNKALTLFAKALEQDPNSIPAHIGVGEIYQAKGDLNKAADQYDAARKLAPNNFDANYKLGLMYQLLNRISEAVQVYLSALTIQPDDFNANLNIATAYLQMGQPVLAVPYAEKATKLQPDSQPAWVNLGSIYSAVNRPEDAVGAYRAAADRGDLSPPIATNLINALVHINKFSRAENVLRTMLVTHPTEPRYHERMGYVQFKLGQYDAATQAYNKALKLAPADVASLNGLGVVLMAQYLQTGRTDFTLRDQALASWRRSVQLQKDQSKIIDLLSRYGTL